MDLTKFGAPTLAALIAFGASTPASAGAPAHDRPIVLAQVMRASNPGNDQRREDQYLDVVKQLRSQCGNAAWSLWRSNGYEAWRGRKSSMFNMHYMTRSYPKLPDVPPSLPEAVRPKLEAAAQRANDLIKESGETFKQLADYINAKDYEDDKFKKGDEINAKLMQQGLDCHRLFAEMTSLYTETAEKLIESRKGAAAKPDVVATMIGDWQKVRALSAELGRFEKADLGKLDGLVREASALVDERRANFAPLKDNPDSSLKRFYEQTLNDDVAVKMRRFLREAKNPKTLKDAAEDRPRSQFWSVRSEIEVDMPDSLLSYIRSAK